MLEKELYFYKNFIKIKIAKATWLKPAKRTRVSLAGRYGE